VGCTGQVEGDEQRIASTHLDRIVVFVCMSQVTNALPPSQPSPPPRTSPELLFPAPPFQPMPGPSTAPTDALVINGTDPSGGGEAVSDEDDVMAVTAASIPAVTVQPQPQPQPQQPPASTRSQTVNGDGPGGNKDSMRAGETGTLGQPKYQEALLVGLITGAVERYK